MFCLYWKIGYAVVSEESAATGDLVECGIVKSRQGRLREMVADCACHHIGGCASTDPAWRFESPALPLKEDESVTYTLHLGEPSRRHLKRVQQILTHRFRENRQPRQVSRDCPHLA